MGSGRALYGKRKNLARRHRAGFLRGEAWEWRRNQGDPLKDIRAYRNRLVHGRVVPEWHVRVVDTTGVEHGTQLKYPRLDRVDKYVDWRPAFAPGSLEALLPEFEDADVLVREAWERVLAYVESSWQAHLT